MSLGLVETTKAEKLYKPFLHFWSFVTIQTLQPDQKNYQTYATIRSNYPTIEIEQRFPGIDIPSLPKALYGLTNRTKADGIDIIGNIEADSGRITLAGADLNEKQFKKIAKAGYVYSGFDLAKGPESETPSVSMKIQALASGDRPKIFGVPYDLYTPLPVWSDEAMEKALNSLFENIPTITEQEDLKLLNNALFQATGLNLFEITQALVHIYNNDAPDKAEDRNFKDAESFVAAKIGIHPALVPLIINIALPEHLRTSTPPTGPLLLGSTPELLEAGDLTENSKETQIMGLILGNKENWLHNRDNPEVLNEMIETLVQQGHERTAVKRQLGIMYLTVEPWLSITNITSMLRMRRGTITLSDLPDYAQAERIDLANRGRKGSIREVTGKKVVDPTTSKEILFDDWIDQNMADISSGQITISSILSMFPNLDRQMVRYHIRKKAPDRLQEILALDRNTSPDPLEPDPRDPLQGRPMIPMAEINSSIDSILKGSMTQNELVEAYDLPLGAIFSQIFRGRVDAEQLDEIRLKLRQNTLDHIFNLFKQGLTNGEYRSPASLAREFHIAKRSIDEIINTNIGEDPYYQELRERAIREKWSRTALDTQKGLERPLGGVKYSSYREAMTGLLLMLYTNYLPLEGINFHIRKQDRDRIFREIDFKLLNEIRSEVMWLEYGPPVKALGFHKADQALYMQSRQELVRKDERVAGLTSLRGFADFLESNFGIALPADVARKIGTFENQEVTLGPKRSTDIKDAIPMLFENPELIAEIFDPKREFHTGLLNIFIRQINPHPEMLERIRALYPNVDPAQFDQDFQEVRNRLQMAIQLKKIVYEQAQRYKGNYT